MAFQVNLSGIPIVGSLYNMGAPQSSVISPYSLSAAQWTQLMGFDPQGYGSGSWQKFLAMGCKIINIPSNEIGHNLFIFEFKGETTERINIYCSSVRDSSFGKIGDYSASSNLVLSYGGFQNAITPIYSTYTYMVGGWKVYSDAVGADFLGYFYQIFIGRDYQGVLNYVNMLPASGNGASFINVKYAKSLGYEVTTLNIDVDLGEASEAGGYGQSGKKPAFDHSSDVISIPDAPSVSTRDAGFMHVYQVSGGLLNSLGQYLFPDILEMLTNADLTGIARAMATTFAYRDSIQYVVDLHAIPVAPTTSASDYIKVGALSTDISAPVVASDYIDFDCGSVSIPENYQNYIDYLTTAKLFLPFVGYVDIKPELWNGGTLSVKYRFNVIDGSFMCFVSSSSGKSQLYNTVVAQYSGAACLHLPVVAASYGSIIGGLMAGGGALASTAAQVSGGDATLSDTTSGVSNAITNFNLQRPMQQSNSYNASASYMGSRRPYLMIERPVPSMSASYPHENGFPLNVSMQISGVHGFTVIENIDLSGISATDEEKEELKSILAGGVYL